MRRLFENRTKPAKEAGLWTAEVGWDGDNVDFACVSGGEGPVLESLSALGLNASYSTNRTMHDFVTKLALLNRMLGSV